MIIEISGKYIHGYSARLSNIVWEQNHSLKTPNETKTKTSCYQLFG